jgi:hypothetical protein
MAIISAIAEENRMGLVVGIFGACFHDPLPSTILGSCNFPCSKQWKANQ